MKNTLKETIKKAMEHYESNAAWEKKKAEQATKGSDIQHEVLRASEFNRGRSCAMREVLDLLDRFIG